MSLRTITSLTLTALLVAACSGAGASVAPSASATPAGTPSTRIEVDLTDGLRVEPANLTVPAGVPVTFVVTNTGATDHEFYLGDEAAQDAHEQEMMAGGPMHDDPNGISLKPGETKELTHTFTAGEEMLAGCHVAGHYAAGMKATITVAG